MLTKRIIPCLDVDGGRVVKGVSFVDLRDAGDPAELSAFYNEQGGDELIFLDITASSDSRDTMVDVVQRVSEQVFIPLTVGGGIRSLRVAKNYSDVGVDRLILGTVAVDSPSKLAAIMESVGKESVIVSVDARSGIVALDGWTRTSQIKAADLVSDMFSLGVIRCMYTDIDRDGTLSTPNFDAISNLVNMSKVSVIAAGGISSLDSILRLARSGVEAAIVGRAIYTGHVNLKEALNAINEMR